MLRRLQQKWILILSNVDTKDISDEHPVMTPWEARVYLMTGQLIKNEDDH